MAGLREFLARLRGLLTRRGGDARVEEEMGAHRDALEASYLRRGLSHEEARRTARLDFGNPALVREAYASQRGLPPVESLAQDVRYALRLLRRSPGFTLTAVLTLAVDMGVNTTIFTAVD